MDKLGMSEQANWIFLCMFARTEGLKSDVSFIGQYRFMQR